MKKLVTDVTEFKVAGRQGVPIARHGPLQQRNRGVVGIEERRNMAQTMEMLSMLVLEPLHQGPALLHSDQGWQYQRAHAFRIV